MLTSHLSCLVGLVLAGISHGQRTFQNPVLYEDYPDNDISRGPDGAYYFSASNFHYSPGAPILRSYDLVNWEPVGHSIPRLNFNSDSYDLPASGERGYRGGTWASTLRYRASTKTWYWIGCTNFWLTWVFTAPSVEGPWTRAAQIGEGGTCYYDCGLLIDDRDDMYVVYGNPEVSVAALSADGLSQASTTTVLRASDVGVSAIEGNRMYQINGTYYILNDDPSGATYIWKSDRPTGPYTSKQLISHIGTPLPGGSSPCQGSLVEAPGGAWYFMSFTWAYPSGRLPVLAPLAWGADGFPALVRDASGGWGSSYPAPPLLPARGLANWTGTDTFRGAALGPKWEWNHNPDTTRFAVGDGGLTLRTASVTDDIYAARNTLTHRVHGEFPRGVVHIDFAGAADGDRFGLAAFRDRSAYIGVHREGGVDRVVAAFNMTIDEYGGQTLDLGAVVATAPVPSGATDIWLRTDMDARPDGDRTATFHYSLDGRAWTQLGGAYELYTSFAFFLGYRFAIFNFATSALGGSIKVLSFTTS
ncbi:putative glycosyl hydrolase family 43 protein [Rosellinia necatrix]|uniref:Putative glycosyl hydrolase family 43 protein n=1 Tax=Rosellinia necatrix TaxID=77044 RepID=A0A1W2TH03_ROSNE|nr:putative glycosyl hydrolase family 43 protein [Rosellinia necatrix]